MGRKKIMKKKINPIYIDNETESYINAIKAHNKWNLSELIRNCIKHYAVNESNIISGKNNENIISK